MTDEQTGGGLYEHVVEALVYPFRGEGVFLLLVGAVFFWLANFLTFLPLVGSIVGLLTFAYFWAYLLEIMRSSATGKDQLPGWVPITDFWNDIAAPCLLAVMTIVLSGLPLIGIAVTGATTSWDPPTWSWIAAGVVSVLYLPMSLLAVNLGGSITAMNPAIIVPSIMRVPGDYLIACMFLVLLLGVEGILGDSMGQITVIGSLLRIFVSLYFGAVEMRILGVLYHINRHELGWFG